MINKKISAISVVLLLFVFLANSRSQKQGTESKGIRTTMVVSRQSVLPYESLSVALLVRNETTEDKRVVASWRSFLSIGAVTAQGTKWRNYLADNEPTALPPVPSSRDFAPGEVKKEPAHIDYEAPSGEHVFAHPGRYVLQGTASDDGRFL